MVRAVFVTTNEHKRREAQAILGFEIETVSLDIPEVQTLDVAEAAVHKARTAREALGALSQPVVAEDSGLVIASWNGLPGALTKWFVSSVGVRGMLDMLTGEDRSAKAVCAVAVAGPDGEARVFVGEVEGAVADAPRGASGFGWDPIFIPEGSDETYAQMGEEKNRDSHRARAFRAARSYFEVPENGRTRQERGREA